MGRVIKAWELGERPVYVTAPMEEAAKKLIEARFAAEGLRNRLQHDVIDLAIAVAENVVGQSIERGALDLQGIYRRALESARSLERGTIHVHPEDRNVSGVEKMAGASGFEIHDDVGVGRGGCRIRCGEVEVDATFKTAFETLEQAMKEGLND